MNINSGKYIGLEVRNMRLVGQAYIKYDIYYQTSSSGVYNSDGVNVYISCGTGYRHVGKLIIGSNKNSETYWGTFHTSIDNSDSWFYLTAYCEDSVSPASYPKFTTTSPSVLGYKGDLSYAGIAGAGPNSCTIKANIRNMFSEDMTYKNYYDVYEVQALGATSASGSAQNITYTMNNIPTNTRFSKWSGSVPDGGNASSPWAWLAGKAQTSITYATTFSNMSMPTVYLSRSGTNVTISWSAGGTTNKPNGEASRTGKIYLKNASKTIIGSAQVNLEAAGSYTFNNISTSTSVYAQAEYTVVGLVNSSGVSQNFYQYSNENYLEGFSATGYIKVNGAYKKTLETYVKVNGSYKKVLEGYIKVNGAYKKIV